MISLRYLYELVHIDQLTDLKYKKQFIKVFNDAKNSKNHIIYALEDNKKIIGGIVINTKPNKLIYQKYNIDPEVSISFFYILPKYRSKGYGKKLLDIPIKQYSKIALTTNDDTTSLRAKEMYKKLGFNIIHTDRKTNYWYLEK